MATFVTAASQITAQTWNSAVSNGETGSARVDLFYRAVRGIDRNQFLGYLARSFNENPLDTLKIIAYIRDCRGGKGERDFGRWGIQYLANHAPKIFARNISNFVNIGRFDDLFCLYEVNNVELSTAVTNYLSNILQSDLATLNENVIEVKISDEDEDSEPTTRKEEITLLGKWLPTERSAMDKKYHIVSKICKKLKWERKTYRQNLSALRSRLHIVEKHMCVKNYDAINYSAVPSRCMHIHSRPKMAFPRNDEDRFNEYTDALKRNDPTVSLNVAQLYPHEIVKEYLQGYTIQNYNEMTEQKWARYIDEKITSEMRESMASTMVVADVSGSMMGGIKTRPIDVCIGLALMIAETLPGALHNHIMTFSDRPSFYEVIGTTLFDRVRSITKAPWGMSTNIEGTFQTLLDNCVRLNVPTEEMPKRIIIISDMQFNNCGKSTNLDRIKELYEASGYQLPKLIFWNVNGTTTDFPALADDNSSVLLSGFSIELLEGVITDAVSPLNVITNLINKPRYDAFVWEEEDFELI
jgi:hypothetical protein